MSQGTEISSVPRIHAPSDEVFLAEFVAQARPVIMTGIVDQWPARQLWSKEHIRDRFGHMSAPVQQLQGGCIGRDPDVGQLYEVMNVRAAVELVYSSTGPTHYLAAPLEGFMQPLLEEVHVPAYIQSADLVRSRFWMSASDAVTPLHRDYPDNLFAQVVGRKHFIILAPTDEPYVYAFPPDSRLPEVSPVDAEAPDYERFPLFRGARRIEFEVIPGDLLYLPSKWWHQVKSCEPCMSINWWWERALPHS